MKKEFLLVPLLILLSGCQTQQKNPTNKTELEGVFFQTSDADLNDLFNWAKNQALAYAFDDDPVGLWYEASLPGREAFCMRDVSHQSMGAQFLGLAEFQVTTREIRDLWWHWICWSPCMQAIVPIHE